MKMLILLVLASGSLLAGEMDSSNPVKDIKNEIVSSVQEVQISKTLQDSIEFKECRDKYQLGKNDDVQNAIKCFQDKIKDRSQEDLEKLSNALGLQRFGLVSSKSQKDLTEYLSNN